LPAEPGTQFVTLIPEELQPLEAYRLLHSVVIPRPIGWISTLSPEGVPNLAPYSCFNLVANPPPTLMVAIGSRRGEPKDTLANARARGEFVANLVDESLAQAMNLTAAEWPAGVNEFEKAGLESAPSLEVQVPRVARAAVSMEARVSQIVPVEGANTHLVLGRVVRYHIRSDLLRPGMLVDAERLRPLMRLGGAEYGTLGQVFEMPRPRVEKTDD
jgi:flavin reductase (DIM6/NTAB) family NADH-FMN oxidoreductase RutF